MLRFKLFLSESPGRRNLLMIGWTIFPSIELNTIKWNLRNPEADN